MGGQLEATRMMMECNWGSRGAECDTATERRRKPKRKDRRKHTNSWRRLKPINGERPFLPSVKLRSLWSQLSKGGSECLVDEATGTVSGKPGQPATGGLQPISAVRLEQMSKAVRWLVIELQHGSGASSASAHPNPAAPFDARFSEDAAQ
ncbi:hypothetical protein HAX54_029659 [Datura stramonium]|uniref:Uncharacterized protein n=1 Tax=Datura stramonium TaxID=4076 RepID=A0ABS8SAG2_DATST|nr:hypothetical protein [Datura stramonium]